MYDCRLFRLPTTETCDVFTEKNVTRVVDYIVFFLDEKKVNELYPNILVIYD